MLGIQAVPDAAELSAGGDAGVKKTVSSGPERAVVCVCVCVCVCGRGDMMYIHHHRVCQSKPGADGSPEAQCQPDGGELIWRVFGGRVQRRFLN